MNRVNDLPAGSLPDQPASSALDYLLSPHTGHPFILDSDGCRQLHFDLMNVQTSMRLDAPFELGLSYTRLMMMFLLFNEAPKDILIVGLGGGTLSKFCYRYLPDSRVTTVEINPAVIALRDDFMIPPDSERFSIVEQDAAAYLVQHHDSADVIMLDGFDAYGLPPELSSDGFYASCQLALREHGVLCANLLGSDLGYGNYVSRIRRCFDDNVLWGRAPSSSNQVVIASRDRIPSWAALRARGTAIAQRFDLDFSVHLACMERRATERQQAVAARCAGTRQAVGTTTGPDDA